LAVASTKPLITVTGGGQRYHSVFNALRQLAINALEQDWVLVHDAVRPCLTRQDLDRLIAALKDDPIGGILATPVRDTLKRGNIDGRIAETVDRTELWHALTPQMFRFEVLYTALQTALANLDLVTDEASAVERAGLHPRLIEGQGDNIKITRPEDLALAERILAAQAI
jgi:2-C-methyl-D-erythritol 4-phosphate cytidylyltransferase